ncbi:MAG: hypothetical protein HRT43_03580 [Campylobacteraceae bacterium]|nr:hypothetical protein [Campylobacteraceae bacterium]
MSNIKKLEKLLKDDVLLEVSENITELQDELSKKENKGIQDDLKYMQDIKAYFDEALLNIENGSLSEEIATEMLEDLEGMKFDEYEV